VSERIWYLKRLSLFESLPPEQLTRLESRCRIRTFPRGTFVYAPRDSADGVLLLASGRIEVYTITDDGKRAILAFIEPGEVFGELAVLGTGTREEYAEACQTATVILMPAEAFRELMETHAQVSLAVTKLIGLRRQRLERRLKSLLFRSTRQRLIHALLDLAEEYGQSTPQGVELGIRLSHQQLANLIGSTRESVTIALGELQAEKCLRVGRRRIVLTNLEALARAVDAPSRSLASVHHAANTRSAQT